MKKRYLEKGKQIASRIIEDRRWIHQHPEIGMELPETCAYVRKRLESMGYVVESCGGGLTTTCGNRGKTILLRADMDGLKVEEESELEFCSKNGFSHMCGHDLHTAMLLGAAEILKTEEANLCGTVKFMFQPGEEVMQGANAMIEEGILENPSVDAALSMHVITNVKDGLFSYKKGMCFSSLDIFRIHIYGKGTHGSAPELGIDPLYAAVQIYQQLNGIVMRETNMFHSAVLTVGHLEGGSMPNVIPQHAVLEGTLRCFDADDSRRIMNRVRTIAEGVCQGLGTTMELDVESLGGVYNQPDLCDDIAPFFKELLGNKFVETMSPASASEDFALIAERVPAMYLLMGVGEPGEPANHNPKAYFSECHMHMGSTALAYAVAKWLEKESKR